MTNRLHSPTTGPARFICRAACRIIFCSSVVLAGCASVAPSIPPAAEPVSGAAPTEVRRSLRIADNPGLPDTPTRTPRQEWLPMPDVKLVKVEIADPPRPPRTIDLIDEPDDLFQRIRHGFSMPELNDDLVLYHQQWYMSRPDYLRRMVDRSSRYLHHIVEELDKRGMPTELALLPMVESAYNPMAYSRAKASGLWQFIPATGKRYNLDQNWWKDDRRDIVASTSAALDYLQSIYEMHGDWHLALASYNWGEGAVGRAVEKNRARGLPTDYLSLTMPNETRNYVPKLQALKNIIRNTSLVAELGLPKVPNRPYFATVTTDAHIDVKVAARLAEMPVEEFVALNPAHNRPVIKPDTSLVIPAEKLETFVNNLEAHEDDNKPLSAWRTYTLRPGDKLEKIAPRFGMTVANLRAVNGITGKLPLSPGLTLLVSGQDKGGGGGGKPADMAALPEQPRLPNAEPEPRGKLQTHTLGKGETLAAVARKYGTTVAELRRINGLRSDKLAAGTRIQVAAAAPQSKEATKERPKPAPTAKAKPAQKPSKVARYKVRTGDTVYSIARQFKVATDDLLRWNGITPNALKPGTTLTIQFAQN